MKISLGGDEKVSTEENESLEAPFSEAEVKQVVFSSYLDGVSGPDGITFMVYQKFWDLVKKDLLVMFDDFYKGNLYIYIYIYIYID
jgi:hypothetical protein